MNTRERVNAIQRAIMLVAEARDLVDEAVEGTSAEGQYRAYGGYGFDRLLNNGNPYDEGLKDIIEELDNN